MGAATVTPPPEHDCPHRAEWRVAAAECRAICAELRPLIAEAHAVLARLKHREEEHRPTDALDESER